MLTTGSLDSFAFTISTGTFPAFVPWTSFGKSSLQYTVYVLGWVGYQLLYKLCFWQVIVAKRFTNLHQGTPLVVCFHSFLGGSNEIHGDGLTGRRAIKRPMNLIKSKEYCTSIKQVSDRWNHRIIKLVHFVKYSWNMTNLPNDDRAKLTERNLIATITDVRKIPQQAQPLLCVPERRDLTNREENLLKNQYVVYHVSFVDLVCTLKLD